MSTKDKNKGGASRPKHGTSLVDLLSPETQALLKRTRDGLPEGWGELFCLPGEIVLSVVADPGQTIYTINGILAFSGGDEPEIMQAGFRSPVSGQWLDAMPRARTKWLSRQKRPAALMALPIDNCELVPANAPEGTREMSLKIRWVQDGSRILYSLDREKFTTDYPFFHRNVKTDPMFGWLEQAIATLGREMLMLVTAKYSRYTEGLDAGFNKPETVAAAVTPKVTTVEAVRAPVEAEEGTDPWASAVPAGSEVQSLTLEDFAGDGGISEEDVLEAVGEAVPGEVHDLNLKPLALATVGAGASTGKFGDLPDSGEEEDAWAAVPSEG